MLFSADELIRAVRVISKCGPLMLRTKQLMEQYPEPTPEHAEIIARELAPLLKPLNDDPDCRAFLLKWRPSPQPPRGEH